MAKASSNKSLKLTLVRSQHGRVKSHQDTVRALGMNRMHSSVVVPDNAAIRGMINKVSYMLKVEEA